MRGSTYLVGSVLALPDVDARALSNFVNVDALPSCPLYEDRPGIVECPCLHLPKLGRWLGLRSGGYPPVHALAGRSTALTLTLTLNPHPSPSPSPNANANANSTLAHVGARARQKDQRLEILHVARAHWLRHLHIVRDANTDLGSG